MPTSDLGNPKSLAAEARSFGAPDPKAVASQPTAEKSEM
jgi:hypothetical protein